MATQEARKIMMKTVGGIRLSLVLLVFNGAFLPYYDLSEVDCIVALTMAGCLSRIALSSSGLSDPQSVHIT